MIEVFTDASYRYYKFSGKHVAVGAVVFDFSDGDTFVYHYLLNAKSSMEAEFLTLIKAAKKVIELEINNCVFYSDCKDLVTLLTYSGHFPATNLRSQLDKDLVAIGRKLYLKESLIFVPREQNRKADEECRKAVECLLDKRIVKIGNCKNKDLILI